MPQLPLATAQSTRSESPLLRLLNRYFEKDPGNLENQVALIPRARLKQFAVVGPALVATPITGLYRKGGVLAASGFSGAILARAGDQLYRVTQVGLPGVGTATLIGTLPGPFRMSAEGDPDRVIMTCGEAPYSTDGLTLSVVAMPPGFLAYAIDYSAGRFLFASDNGRFYWTDPGVTTVDPLNFATAEQQPDVLITLKVAGDELWLFGRLSVEVWQPTGDTDLPYQLIVGRVFGIGITARQTCQKMNVGGVDTVAWLGTDRIVYRTAPNPVRISEHWLEEILNGVAAIADCYATVDVWEGHDFYVLHVPDVGSFAYDLETQQWHERRSYGLPVFRVNTWAVGPNNQPLKGDLINNVIWEMTDDVRLDGADPVLFQASGMLELTDASARCDNVSLDVSTGLNPDPAADPMMYLDMSDDRGRSFGLAMAAPLGRSGNSLNVAAWFRLGLMRRPGRVFRFSTTEPCTIHKAKYNEVVR